MGAHDKASQVSAMVSDGYSITPDLFSESEMIDSASVLSDCDLPRSRAGIWHVLRHPAVATLANDPRLMNIAREVLGADAFPFHATLFEKSPDANWLVVWHQDTALPLRERRDVPGWGPWSVKDGVTYAHAPGGCEGSQNRVVRGRGKEEGTSRCPA